MVMERSNLQHTVLQPRSDLKKYVRRILITEGDESTDEVMPIIPTGFGYFTYSRYPVRFDNSVQSFTTDEKFYLVGQLENEKPAFTIKDRCFHVGLELYPLVPFYAFGITGNRLTDTGIDSKTLFEIAGSELFSGIDENDNAQTVADKLQWMLLKRVNDTPRLLLLEKCLDEIYAARGSITVCDLTDRMEISERSLRRQFKKYVGIGIKKYLKTIQFNSVFETISNGNHEEIYQTALEYGFYDHAHFINLFTGLLGSSPQKFINNPDEFLLTYLGNKARN